MTVAVTSTEPVTVRLMRVEDLGEVTNLFHGADDDALHDRFFTLGDRVVAAHLADLTALSHPRCHVAVADGHVVGIAEMAPIEAGTEEVAFFVATGRHHHGIGTTLLAAAIADARFRGVRTLVADVLATNHLMLQVFTDAGATLSRQDGEVRVTLPVDVTGLTMSDDAPVVVVPTDFDG